MKSGELLIQAAPAGVPSGYGPMYWSNSCCSHPLRGMKPMEDRGDAATPETKRLGIRCPLHFLFQIQYSGPQFDANGRGKRAFVRCFVGTVPARACLRRIRRDSRLALDRILRRSIEKFAVDKGRTFTPMVQAGMGPKFWRDHPARGYCNIGYGYPTSCKCTRLPAISPGASCAATSATPWF